jgi:serine/threonine protein kinase
MQPTTELTGRYHLQELIAAGGMGEVWRAVDEVLGRPARTVRPGIHPSGVHSPSVRYPSVRYPGPIRQPDRDEHHERLPRPHQARQGTAARARLTAPDRD